MIVLIFIKIRSQWFVVIQHHVWDLFRSSQSSRVWFDSYCCADSWKSYEVTSYEPRNFLLGSDPYEFSWFAGIDDCLRRTRLCLPRFNSRTGYAERIPFKSLMRVERYKPLVLDSEENRISRGRCLIFTTMNSLWFQNSVTRISSNEDLFLIGPLCKWKWYLINSI